MNYYSRSEVKHLLLKNNVANLIKSGPFTFIIGVAKKSRKAKCIKVRRYKNFIIAYYRVCWIHIFSIKEFEI